MSEACSADDDAIFEAAISQTIWKGEMTDEAEAPVAQSWSDGKCLPLIWCGVLTAG